jgi:hypothetical protein
MQTLAQPHFSPPNHFNYSARYAFERLEDRASDARASQLRQADNQFVQMLNGFRESGGLARLQEVAELCACHGGPDIESLSRSLARREVICFEWQSHGWLPLFQFNPNDMRLCSQVQPVISELSCIYDPWDLAFWFSQPNPWLANRAPADALLSDPSTVLQAARADRFVAD